MAVGRSLRVVGTPARVKRVHSLLNSGEHVPVLPVRAAHRTPGGVRVARQRTRHCLRVAARESRSIKCQAV
jgi:hypothetical protein